MDKRNVPGFLAKLFGRGNKDKKAEAPPAKLNLADGEVVNTDLDKAWHGIHYMLTQTAWEGDEPWNFLVLGGRTVGDIEVGYGPARVFFADEVRTIGAALRTRDRDFLRARFNPKEMMKLDIYPSIWDSGPTEDDTFEYCAAYFETLKAFIDDAVRRNVGIVMYVT